MSFEGFEQHICASGHLYEVECAYMFGDDPDGCLLCGQHSVWRNIVDNTNGNAVGFIPDHQFTVLTPRVTEICNLRHEHTMAEPTYKVPTEAETAKMRHYWDDVKGMYVPLSLVKHT